MNKSKILVLFMIFAAAMSAFADITVTGEAPTLSNPDLNGLMQDAYNDLLGDLQDMIGGINSKPEKLIRAWGNSAVFASHGGTHRGYSGYKFMTITLGSMIGMQLPDSPLGIISDVSNLKDKILNDGDIDLGFSPQFLNAQIGFNTSFLVKHLYLGARLGWFTLPGLVDGLSFKTTTVGVTANYQLLPSLGIAKIIVWRGINLGSGIIFNNSRLEYSLPLDPMSQDMGGGVSLAVDPTIKLNMKINTVTVPLEAMTALKLLIFNIPFGVGADVSFGKSNIGIGLDAEINTEGLPSGVTQEKPGNFNVKAGGSMPPYFFNTKIMTGIGFNFGPVMIDIPFTYYLPGKNKNNGFNVGVTAGASF